MALPKKIRGRVNPAGMEERSTLLSRCGHSLAFLNSPPPRGCGEDDFLDACAMLLIAARHARGETRPFPDPHGRDEHGIPVAINV